VAVFVITPVSCKQKQESSSAYKRWGITKSLTDSLGEKELASAYDLLYGLKFVDAKSAYEKIVERFPTSAEAHLGLSMSYRYLGKLSEAVIECEQALSLDSNAIGSQLNYADLLSPFRGAKLKENLSDSARYTLATSYYEKALKSKHPLATYAHIGLWNIDFIYSGQLSITRKQMLELGKKNYFPASLKDFAYNILITAEPDAIIFTNGDNDTYPLLCLQESENIRRDISVVNINSLNVPRVAMLMRDSMKVPISFSDSMIVNMRPKKDKKGFWIYPADNLIANIVENARAMKRPVYFTVTVDRNRVPYYTNFFITEGLLMRMADIKTKDSINIDKVTENLNKNYRLNNISKKEVWSSNLSPITRDVINLSINYVAVGNQLAQYYEKQGNKKEALHYYHWAYKIIEQIGRADLLEPIKNKIKELKL
jgi:tetratricopeptide (TPR) repeat protein